MNLPALIRILAAKGMSAADIADIIEAGEFRLHTQSSAPAKPNDTAVHVYVMQTVNGHVKVGISQHPHWRAKALSAEWRGVPEIRWVSAARSRREACDIERKAHLILGEDRIEGEWFSCSPELAIAAVKDAGGAAQ